MIMYLLSDDDWVFENYCNYALNRNRLRRIWPWMTVYLLLKILFFIEYQSRKKCKSAFHLPDWWVFRFTSVFALYLKKNASLYECCFFILPILNMMSNSLSLELKHFIAQIFATLRHIFFYSPNRKIEFHFHHHYQICIRLLLYLL